MENEILDATIPKVSPEAIERSMASKGRRFANFLIDTITLYALIFIVAFLTGDIFSELIDGFANAMDHPVWSRLFGAVMFFLFYLMTEWFLKGKSIGKFVTNTRVVMADGAPLTLSAVMKRSAIRLVPFEAFSFLAKNARGWHDKWSETAVVYLPALQASRSVQMDEELFSQHRDSIVN